VVSIFSKIIEHKVHHRVSLKLVVTSFWRFALTKFFWPPVSTHRWQITTGINDTGGKFVTGVVATGVCHLRKRNYCQEQFDKNTLEIGHLGRANLFSY
jgi:hypothetical protein